MEFEMEILCNEYKHKVLVDDYIIVDTESEEYYIIPITKEMGKLWSGEAYRLSFKNQMLWLKYSNSEGKILVKNIGFTDFIVIKSEDIIDIYMYVSTSDYFRKNVWQSKNNVRLNKKYTDNYILCIPIIEDMINVKEFGDGVVKEYQIHMISNEAIISKTTPQSHNCNLMVTNNFLLNKEALFICLNEKDVNKFFN